MSRAGVEAVAEALLAARRSGMPADATPLADALADADEAYAAQQRVAETLGWFAAGAPRHWKSGGPGRTQPLTHAPLPPAGVWRHPADASRWPMHTRLVESEVALRLGREVDAALAARLDLASASALVDAMAVAIEIVDSRWQQGLAAPALLRLADLASHAALVLGHWVPYAPRDWSEQRCRLVIGAQEPVQRRGTHSCGDPAWVLADWLRHATARHGTLPAGTVVTTGTWAGAPAAAVGDRVLLSFDDIGEAEAHF
ncbi:fumarylacetoacetate hydrolase family protein [uncultured Piscinibacter sp.]|uniref:fumarylacetoacetate hydrolase family protein n=1 Tax=uncultured Piscinibacter sp. TaxID=1131835 RepID=UPI002619FE2A|nr:fumarylacetoacetate hydrolase family protein [uncultured Piscinibacter sp.]